MTPQGAKAWALRAGLQLRYSVDLERLAAVAAPFVQLALDDAGAAYIGAAEARRHGIVTTWLHRRLRAVFSDFDVNGLLGTYPMHVLSTAQWRTLLSLAGHPTDRPLGRILDVGAGRGDVTAQLAPLFESVVVSETSRPMARRLRRLGYPCLQGDIVAQNQLRGEHVDLQHSFDVVSLLNVLDRCDRPLSLLAAARGALRPGGLLLVALVLPYRPFVYERGGPRAPLERLAISSETFEQAAAEFATITLQPLGLEVLALSRVPYLSGGDAQAPLYELDDLIAVCRAQDSLPLID